MEIASARIAIPNHVRKEWRAVTEGSPRDRPSPDGSSDHSYANGSARTMPNSGLHQENSRSPNFHPVGSGNSSDSDHHTSDLEGASSQEFGHPMGANTNIFDEIQRLHKKSEHLDSAMNGLPNNLLDSSTESVETLDQRLHHVIQQREQLQQMEVELRAQLIARSEVLRVQNSYDEQTKQQTSIVTNLQEQLQERECRMHDLERQFKEREQQLHANQREASEAVSQVWLKDSLLHEQTNELAALRRERDTMLSEQKATLDQFEAERAKLLSQLQDMRDQVQEKEHQLQELDEQHRSIQAALSYRDEQLRDAQSWVQRAQERGAFHANAHNSLHAELRDCTEQINQLWMGHQRQLADIERYHNQTVERLQLEVAEMREQNRILRSAGSGDRSESKDEVSAHCNSKEGGCFNISGQSVGSVTKLSTLGCAVVNNTSVLPNGDSQTKMLHCEAPAKVEYGNGLPVVVAAPVVGMTPDLSSGSLPVLNQFAVQPQGVASSIPAAPSRITQLASSQLSNPTIHFSARQIQQRPQSSQVQWYPHRQQLHTFSHPPYSKPPHLVHPRDNDHQQQHAQLAQEGMDQGVPFKNKAVHLSQSANVPATGQSNFKQLQAGQQMHCQSSKQPDQQTGELLPVEHGHEEKHAAHSQQLALQASQKQQVQPQQEVATQQHHELIVQLDCQSVQQVCNPDQGKSFSQQPQLHQVQLLSMDIDLKTPPINSGSSSSKEDRSNGSWSSACYPMVDDEVNDNHGLSNQRQIFVPSTGQQPAFPEGSGKVDESMLLDERSLLACLVRAIPVEASARIKISTTLPNRLGKMLAPLHWHDYRKQYGRLDAFVSSHPELFVIDGDFINLREGAHAIISATTTVAKIAAAVAAASPSCRSWSPTVAVTPAAQPHTRRLRKVIVASPIDVRQGPPTHVQATNIQQGGLFPQPQSCGSSRLDQGAFASNSSDKRSDRLQFNLKNESEVDLQKATSNGSTIMAYASLAAPKNGVLYRARHSGRMTILGNGPFDTHDFIARPQTQENRVSRSS